MLTQEQFIRNYSVMANGEVDFFLGAGASISSGIPSGGDLIWEFKRTLYCSELGISTEKYKDLALPSTRRLFQNYFDQKGTCPAQYAPNEYSFYFEKCYTSPIARKRFIESIVSGREPSLGYLCLAEIINRGKIKNIWTTNFDSLVERALHSLYPQNNVLVCSAANKSSVKTFNPEYPVIGKLHGDYRYDWLKNTEPELQDIEEEIKAYAASQLIHKQLVVVGYSGNDESIMSFLKSNAPTDGFLDKGLVWTLRKGSQPNPRVLSLIDDMTKNGKTAELVEIGSFESLIFSIYHLLSYSNITIDCKSAKIVEKVPLSFEGNVVDSFAKLNAYVAEGCPLCNVFETDISSWRELRSVIGDSDVIATLYSKHIYAFSSADKLENVFKGHILSTISLEEVPERIIRKNDSIYIGLIYQLIKRELRAKGMLSHKKNKYYNPESMRFEQGFQVYDALEVALNYINGNLYLNLLPTFHVLDKGGAVLGKETYQLQINKYTSSLYNKQYNEKLHFWESLLLFSGRFTFTNDGFRISFITPAVSCGGTNRSTKWPEFAAYNYPEPLMCFSDSDNTKASVNQLKGVCRWPYRLFLYSRRGYPHVYQIGCVSTKTGYEKSIGPSKPFKYGSCDYWKGYIYSEL